MTKQKAKTTHQRASRTPVLRFSPAAWAKLLFLRGRGDTEVGGFGISSEEDLLLIEDVLTVKQEASSASVGFDDEAVADFFDAQVDQGRRPEQFARTWIHTHPGNSPVPSHTDEETFQRVFGGCQWAVMFVLGKKDATYARLRFNVGPGAEAILPVEVEYSRPFPGTDLAAWESEYKANVKTTFPDYGFDAFDDFEDQAAHDEDDSREILDWGDMRLADVFDLDEQDREIVLRQLAHTDDLEEAEEVLDDHYGSF